MQIWTNNYNISIIQTSSSAVHQVFGVPGVFNYLGICITGNNLPAKQWDFFWNYLQTSEKRYLRFTMRYTPAHLKPEGSRREKEDPAVVPDIYTAQRRDVYLVSIHKRPRMNRPFAQLILNPPGKQIIRLFPSSYHAYNLISVVKIPVIHYAPAIFSAASLSVRNWYVRDVPSDVFGNIIYYNRGDHNEQ